MALHHLLSRQLRRLKIDENHLLTDLTQWQEFLSRINRVYLDAEQERYLLERSMNISSHEMMELTSKLQEAQHIAKLGHWIYECKTRTTSWSKELSTLLEIAPNEVFPTYEQYIQLIHQEDRQKVENLIEQAIKQGEDYEIEYRILHRDKKYRWHHMVGHAYFDNQKKSVERLSGIIMDITERKKYEHQLQVIQQKLVDTARLAGMAEVATSILHNVGNILNSAQISLESLAEIINSSYIEKLLSIAYMIQDHSDTLGHFLTEDDKGKLLPEYLLLTLQKLSAQQKTSQTEIKNIAIHLDHIKDIVAMQQTLSGFPSLKEKVYLSDVIDSAIQLCGDLKSRDIHVIKNYQQSMLLEIDKSKLMQILINLIQNAKDALMAITLNTKKTLSITSQLDEHSIKIIIKDNGVGIEPENLTKVFSMGFSTKPGGHGFGLHSSAISAKDLGGTLSANSQGKYQGATFMLTLPRQHTDRGIQP